MSQVYKETKKYCEREKRKTLVVVQCHPNVTSCNEINQTNVTKAATQNGFHPTRKKSKNIV